MPASSFNPILYGLEQLAGGADPDAVLAWRDAMLPDPEAWLDAGFDALGQMDASDARAALVVDTLVAAWREAGEAACGARQGWRSEGRRGAQGLLVKALWPSPGAPA